MKHWSTIKKYLVEMEKVATPAEKRPSCLYDRWLFNTSQKQTHNAGSGPEFLPVLTCVTPAYCVFDTNIGTCYNTVDVCYSTVTVVTPLLVYSCLLHHYCSVASQLMSVTLL